jgi:hypothetical protein
MLASWFRLRGHRDQSPGHAMGLVWIEPQTLAEMRERERQDGSRGSGFARSNAGN